MRHKVLGVAAAIVAVTLASASLTGAADGASQVSAPTKTSSSDRADQLFLEAGLQAAPKRSTLSTKKVNGQVVNAANPYLAEIADPAAVDWSYWRKLATKQGDKRAAAMRANAMTIAIPTPFAYDEQEPAGTLGSNDTQANAELVTKFGLGTGKQAAVRILGDLFQPPVDTTGIETAEDQGAIPIATDTGIPADHEGITVASEIGDGPHGSAGTGSGDFDFFKVSANNGQVLRANTFGSDFDTILLVYSSTGEIVALADDSGGTLQSELVYSVPSDGEYYVMVAGFVSLPEDPFDSSSGTGADAEGAYDLEVTVGAADHDYYAVRLKPGDVVGGTISGGATDIAVHKFDGADRIGSAQDLSFIYPPESPLPGGGNGAFSYVAEQAGLYAVSTGEGSGGYQMHLEVYRPGSEHAKKGAVQTIFLDFDGARVNTGIFGGAGQSTLSPLSSFLARWGLAASDQNKLVNRIVATVKENIKHDLIARGLNGKLKVNVLNSRDHNDPFGKPNVSRVIVGGTIAQSGVDTIGIAQSIDPGNFGHEETALVLLDIVSDSDPENDASFNYYLTSASDKIKFVGTALGNVTSHEVGHYVGSFHVDQFNDVLNLMDQGGNFPLLYGVGDDGIGGTADDPDVDFGTDTYNPNEGLTGLENTLNNSAWGFVPGQ